MFKVPERYRKTNGSMGSSESDGNNGVFMIPKDRNRPATGTKLSVIASDGGGWEHVSVSLPTRCPTWDEMTMIKSIFWSPEDCVVQYHPPESEYVNNHNFCLHLWRQCGVDFDMPPSILTGIKGLSFTA